MGTLRTLKSLDKINTLRFFRITDPPSHYSERANALFEKNTLEFESTIGTKEHIYNHELFERYEIYIESLEEFIASSSGNIIIDISSFPKRFFFPMIKILLESRAKVKNLMVTYTRPNEYSSGYLAEDPEEIRNIPLFHYTSYSEKAIKMAFIGIGFLTLGLPELLQGYKDISAQFFFPFPPGPPAYQRNLEFLHMINQEFPAVGSPKHKIHHVNAYDTSDAFHYICSLTSKNDNKAIFAPYGPKPISLAMCIYASLTKSAVYYTQPRVYNPEYSIGIKDINGIHEIYTYCLRLNGRDLYQVDYS